MAHKKSKLLQALDEVLDSDELDVIQAEIEDDMEADEDELEDEEDEGGGSDGSDENADEDPNTSSTVLQSDPTPLAPVVPAKRKHKSKNKSNSCASREFHILCNTVCLWDLIAINRIPRTHFSNYLFAFDPQRSTNEAVQNQTRTYWPNSRTRIFRTI